MTMIRAVAHAGASHFPSFLRYVPGNSAVLAFPLPRAHQRFVEQFSGV